MNPAIIQLEPAKINKLGDWLSAPEFELMVNCMEKKRELIMLQSLDLQVKSMADANNQNFAQAALDKLAEAREIEITLKILRGLNSSNEWIAKIEL